MKKYNYTQPLKYIAVGVTAVLVDNAVFIIVSKTLGLALIIATITALLSGFIVSFLGNKILVFSASGEKAKHSNKKQIALYTALLTFNVGFTYLFIFMTNSIFGLNEVFAKLVTTCVIVFWNYIIYKNNIFKLKTD